MTITLYRGTEQFQAELDIDEETGEIMADWPLDVLVKRNPIGTCAYILNTLANADMIDEHIKIMARKKKAMQNNAERAKAALKEVMQATGTISVKSDDSTFKAVLSIGRDESVDVFDATQLPNDYQVEKVTYAPDKKMISKAIKDGFDVPGARLVKNDRLTLS